MDGNKPVIIVHGGAGRIAAEDIDACQQGCLRAAQAGWEVMQNGGSALAAVEAAVVILEDDPLFNAGTGAVLNANGEVQLDVSIMDGANLAAGAAAGFTGIANPIRLARRILEDGRHVLLVGQGAQAFAREHEIPICDPARLVTQRQQQASRDLHGTVGAVAFDLHGRLAAGTSTGGVRNALPGRVGDSALIGCGTYANEAAAVSCTGIGEAIIRTVLAHETVTLIESGKDPIAAAGGALEAFQDRTDSEAGLIALDRHGQVGYGRNTDHMPIAVIEGNGEHWTSI